MSNSILIIAAISIAVGIICGAVVVWFISLRRRQAVDSLIRINNIVGRSGIVEIPFDSESQGKVRINFNNSQVDFIAFSDESREFRPGDRVLVVGIKGNKVWVVSEEFSNSDS